MIKRLMTIVMILLVTSVYAETNTGFEPTSKTLAAQQAVIKALPFENTQSFADAQKGFIAPLPNQGVLKEGDKVIWDLSQYDFINKTKQTPDTVNPSLWRQAKLLMYAGLFKVTDGIYQIRNLDLSNITFIEAPDGLIVVDPLLSAETAAAGLKLYYQHRPKKPIKAIIFTHSHVDLYGGVRGIVDEKDIKAGKIKIYAPKGFLENAVSENVLAGNVMARRSSYMYGNLLPASTTGQVGSGLGLTTSNGTVTLLAPTDSIGKSGEKRKIAGLDVEFIFAPDTEAPSEMFFFIPKYKAMTAAEDASQTLHNLYSLRGAKIRDGKAWSGYLNEAIDRWGDKVNVLFGMHHWPVWGQTTVVDYLEKQRDVYKYIHDQTLRLANEGYDMNEIAEKIKLPKSLANTWHVRGYYGSVSHDVKAVYVFYLGYFNGNPATLNPLPRIAAGKKYVEFMGGADNLLKQAQKSYDKGEYRWVAQVVNHLIYADPNNQHAKTLQAKALTQLGYQAESGPWRNFYLTAAKELMQGVKKVGIPDIVSPDTIKAMPMSSLFDYLSIKLNGPKAEGKVITINWNFTDNQEKYTLYLKNSVLNYSSIKLADNPDVTVTLSRNSLDKIILKQSTVAEEVKSGEIKFTGNEDKLIELFSLLDSFDFWFNLVTPVDGAQKSSRLSFAF